MMLRGFRGGANAKSMLRCAQKFQVEGWVKTISGKATTGEGKLYTSQLASIISFYNKSPTHTDPVEVNWEDWSKRINTKDLVSKIRNNTETLLKEKYNSAAVGAKVSGEPTEDYKKISSELKYHYALWTTYYEEHVETLVQLEELGNLSTYLLPDLYDRFEGVEAKAQRAEELGNYLPGVYDDVNHAYYLMSQFRWAKGQFTFYRHPHDDFKCALATKNILGR